MHLDSRVPETNRENWIEKCCTFKKSWGKKIKKTIFPELKNSKPQGFRVPEANTSYFSILSNFSRIFSPAIPGIPPDF